MWTTCMRKPEQHTEAYALCFPFVRVLVLMNLWVSQGENGAWRRCPQQFKVFQSMHVLHFHLCLCVQLKIRFDL